MANTIAEQPALKAEDRLAGMPHSEVHYFNRYEIDGHLRC